MSVSKKQTIGTESFEAIFVVNGPEDGSYEYLRSECQCKGKLRAKILKLSGKGAGYARNFGILASQGEYLTFLDDDDTIGPKYLETLLSKAGANRVVCAQMKDLDSLGNELNSTLADRLAVCLGSVKTLEEVPWVMGYNAAKLIPRGLVGSNRYVESLRSGEDVVFNARVMLPSSPEIWFVESTDQSYYFRHVRDGSLSRVGESFDFNVIQRFEVLKELVDIDSTPKLVDAQSH
ncbi:glycosyltransferase [Bacteroides fragilis]|nr:glycosyltransferase [Bacteroides fragilis]